MNIFLIIYIAIGFTAFEIGKILVKYFLNKKFKEYAQAGFNQAVSHIYKQVSEKGKIDLVLDGKKLILVALKDKK